jgi:uncharacterized protein (TIGR02145 family)
VPTAKPSTKLNLKKCHFGGMKSRHFERSQEIPLLFSFFFVSLQDQTEDMEKNETRKANLARLILCFVMMLSFVFVSCNKDPVPVTDIILSQTDTTLAVGDTLTLIATILPGDATNKSVTWMSNDTTIATVRNGAVVGVSEGSTIITVTTQDGEETASCEVTIVPPVDVTSITLSKTSDTLLIGDTLILTAIVLPDSATFKNVIWLSSNPAVATVRNGMVIAVSFGAATITATTRGGNDTATCEIVVNWGTISFATNQTWTIGSQEWSDAVQTSYCSGKTTFSGNIVSCRSNPGQKGNLFSWRAVFELQDELCPDGWRVPTAQDFVDLDIALGGTGKNRQDTINGDSFVEHSLETQLGWYLNTWGGSYGGGCGSLGALHSQGSWGLYWSSSEQDANSSSRLAFVTLGHIRPQSLAPKYDGYPLRCVRNN